MTESGSDADIARRIAIAVRHVDDHKVAVLAVTGELDLLTTPALQDKLDAVLNGRSTAVVLDLSGVGFLGSFALSTLISSAEAAEADGISFAIVATGHAVLRPLEVTGVRPVFEVFDSVDQALESAR